jgi:hypothetical protein
LTHVFDGPLRHGASVRFDTSFQSHPADVFEHGRAIARQMLNELDRAALGSAEQLRQPPLALDQR